MATALVVGVILVTAAMTLALQGSPGWRQSRPWTTRALGIIAVAASIVTGFAALPLLPPGERSTGDFAGALAPPVILSVAALTALLFGRMSLVMARTAAAVAWLATVLMFAWVIVKGVGLGFLYLPTGALLLAAAIQASLPAVVLRQRHPTA